MPRLVLFVPILLASLSGSGQQSSVPAGSATQSMYDARARSAQKKFDYLRQNGAKPNPNQTPTVLLESEVNAWLVSGNADLPKGVKRLQFTSEPNVIHAAATVDFDEITEGKTSANPLLSLFSGTHAVEATAHASGSGGQGHVHIDSVSIDGVSVPKMALEFFADKYIKPKYPNLGVDSTFALPNRVDTALVGAHQVALTQK